MMNITQRDKNTPNPELRLRYNIILACFVHFGYPDDILRFMQRFVSDDCDAYLEKYYQKMTKMMNKSI